MSRVHRSGETASGWVSAAQRPATRMIENIPRTVPSSWVVSRRQRLRPRKPLRWHRRKRLRPVAAEVVVALDRLRDDALVGQDPRDLDQALATLPTWILTSQRSQLLLGVIRVRSVVSQANSRSHSAQPTWAAAGGAPGPGPGCRRGRPAAHPSRGSPARSDRQAGGAAGAARRSAGASRPRTRGQAASGYPSGRASSIFETRTSLVEGMSRRGRGGGVEPRRSAVEEVTWLDVTREELVGEGDRLLPGLPGFVVVT